jgi:hypothetical protein
LNIIDQVSLHLAHQFNEETLGVDTTSEAFSRVFVDVHFRVNRWRPEVSGGQLAKPSFLHVADQSRQSLSQIFAGLGPTLEKLVVRFHVKHGVVLQRTQKEDL